MNAGDELEKLRHSGLNIIPTKGYEKRPFKAWKEYMLVKKYDFDCLPKSGNYFMVCGKTSGGVVVIDIDTKNDPENRCFQYLYDLIKKNDPGLYDRLLIQQTPSGGYHMVYRCDNYEAGQRLAIDPRTEKPFIETRGQGNGAVIAPSQGYKVIQNDFNSIPDVTKEQRNFLITACRSLDRTNKIKDTYLPSTFRNSSVRLSTMEDFNERFDIYDYLLSRGWTYHSKSPDNTLLTRPGKSTKDGCSAAYREADKVLFVYTSSDVFEPHQAYSPFYVYAQYEYNGDLSAAAKGLYDQGYGERVKRKRRATQEVGPDDVVSFLEGKGVKYNEVTARYEVEGETLTERDINSLFLEIKRDQPKLRKELFHTSLESSEIESYHPVKEALKECKKHYEKQKDGPIDKLCDCIDSDIGFTEDQFNPQIKNVLIRKWLIGMVAGVFPGNYNPLMLILIGPPNTGKTEFFRRLLPPNLKRYMTQSHFDTGKDTQALMCENIIVLFDEMTHLNRSDAKTVRGFVSAETYEYRPPYGRYNVKRHRVATVCGTSNDPDIIDDPENNRRIIPLVINKIDYDKYNLVDKNSLIGEAYSLFLSDKEYLLSKKEIAFLFDISEDHEMRTLELELITQYFKAPAHVNDFTEMWTVGRIASYIQEKTKIRIYINQIGKMLNRLGFDKRRRTISGKKITVYLLELVESEGQADKEGHAW